MVWVKFVLNMINGVIWGVRDSIFDNKVWDGILKEIIIKLEICCLKFRLSFLFLNFCWICLSFFIGMRLIFFDCKKIKLNNLEIMDIKWKLCVRCYIEIIFF